MATQHSRAPSPPGSTAVGITLAPGPGRVAALAIVGVPLAIVLLIGHSTVHDGNLMHLPGVIWTRAFSPGTQMDGDHLDVSGTYTVSAGRIADARIQQTN